MDIEHDSDITWTVFSCMGRVWSTYYQNIHVTLKLNIEFMYFNLPNAGLRIIFDQKCRKIFSSLYDRTDHETPRKFGPR